MNQDKKLSGVLGWPVHHSRSPVLHTAWLEVYKINGAYLPLPVNPEHFAEVISALPKMGFVGCNVTIPHKEQAFALADEATPQAQRLKASNTLYFQDGKILADNTDGYGFMQNLKSAVPHWQPDHGPAVIFGAGGASRAVIAALAEAGLPEIRLANRTRQRAETVIAELGLDVRLYEWSDAARMIAGAQLLVNATSLGMDDEGRFPVDLSEITPEMIVTDLVYTPLMTPFLNEAQLRGARVVDGLGMLLHQAVPGFEGWFGHRPEVTHQLRETVLAG